VVATLQYELARPETTLEDMILGIVSLDAFRRRSLGPPAPESADTAGAD
jgi:hypothetical protein